MLEINDGVFGLVQQGFKTIIGDGLNTDFWFDDWTVRGLLKKAFPHVFALVVNKEGSVANFGHQV